MPACLGTMMVPFGHETSYVKIQAPMAGGGDQDKAIVGGMLSTRATATAAPGQAVQRNERGQCEQNTTNFLTYIEILIVAHL